MHGWTQSCPQRLYSFWSAPRILTSGLAQHLKSVIQTGWKYKMKTFYAPKIRSCQRPQFLVLTKISAASGNKNGLNKYRIKMDGFGQLLFCMFILMIIETCITLINWLNVNYLTHQAYFQECNNELILWIFDFWYSNNQFIIASLKWPVGSIFKKSFPNITLKVKCNEIGPTLTLS